MRSQLDHLAASSCEQKQTYQELAATLQFTQDISTQARQAAESAESVAREAQACIEKARLRKQLYKCQAHCAVCCLVTTLSLFSRWQSN